MITQAAAYIASRPVEQREVIRKLRALVKEAMPEAFELIYHGALGYSSTSSPMDRVVYITSGREHVTLGFMNGTDLRDPARLLEGAGKAMRHVKVRGAEGVSNPALVELVRQAWDKRKGSPRNGRASGGRGE